MVVWFVVALAVSIFLPPAWLMVTLLGAPMAGAILGTLLPEGVGANAWALGVSATSLAAAVAMGWRFDWHAGGYQFNVVGTAVQGLGMRLSLGVDPISLMLVILTAALHPIAIGASWQSVTVRTREHFAWLSFMLFTMLGTFLAKDLLLFYGFFEATLIPAFFLIGIWGGHDRRHAANRYFLYLFAGSIFMLAGVAYVGLKAHTFDLPEVIRFAQSQLSERERFWVLMSFLAAFVVKTPLFPFHTWLPLAHTEAPTAGSADLSSLVLKLGAYGLLRIAVPIGLIGTAGNILFPHVITVLGVLCLVGILYAAMIAWVQTDMKRLIAYSSISHMGFCILGMLAINQIGMAGSVLYMINHGITSAALFLMAGMIFSRYGTRDMRQFSGLGRVMPKMAFFLVLFVMANVGLPGLNGFVSEFLTVLGAFTSTTLGVTFGVTAAIGFILSAVYLLQLPARLVFGTLLEPAETAPAPAADVLPQGRMPRGDLTGRELAMLIPLAVAVVVMGVYPGPMLRSLEAPLNVIRNVNDAGNDAAATSAPSHQIGHVSGIGPVALIHGLPSRG